MPFLNNLHPPTSSKQALDIYQTVLHFKPYLNNDLIILLFLSQAGQKQVPWQFAGCSPAPIAASDQSWSTLVSECQILYRAGDDGVLV